MPDSDAGFVFAVSASDCLRRPAPGAIEQRIAGRNRGPSITAAHPFRQYFDRFHGVCARSLAQFWIDPAPSAWISRLALNEWHEALLPAAVNSCKCNYLGKIAGFDALR